MARHRPTSAVKCRWVNKAAAGGFRRHARARGARRNADTFVFRTQHLSYGARASADKHGEWGIVRREISLGQRIEAGRSLIPGRPRCAGSPLSAAPARSADTRAVRTAGGGLAWTCSAQHGQRGGERRGAPSLLAIQTTFPIRPANEAM